MSTLPKNRRTSTRSSATATAPTSDQTRQEGIYQRNALELQPSTLDKTNRRVQAVLTTEDPVPIYDWRTGEVVDEVLVVSGAQFDTQTPLLRDHSQWSVTSILGSVVGVQSGNDELHGTLEFGRQLDEVAEAIWRRVEQGHLRRGSIGYNYSRSAYDTIPAGETRTVDGRSYTAGKERAKRVVRQWKLLEYSMVVIPADPRAQLKSSEPQGTENNSAQDLSSSSIAPTRNNLEDEMKRFLKFLHSNGLAASVTSESEALDWARSGNLSDELLREFAAICTEENVKFDVTAAKAKQAATSTRSASTAGNSAASQSTSSDQTRGSADTQNQIAEGVRQAIEAERAAERQRVAAIRTLASQHPDVPAGTAQRCIDEGLTVDQTRDAFLSAMRERTAAAPAVHARGSHQITRRVLQAALMLRNDCNITPDSPVLRTDQAQAMATRRRELDLGWAVNVPTSGQRRDELEQAYDIARQRGLHSCSLMRMAELCAELANPGQRFYNEDEILERAFSSGDFSAVFGAVVHMQLLSSYASTPQTYERFCEVVEVNDFRSHSTADMGQVGRLRRMGRNGGEAVVLNTEEQFLTSITAERYAGQLIVDDQTFINDSFGVTGMLPAELGETCQSMVADLAYAQILNSGNLADGRARFNTTDGNLLTVATLTNSAFTSIGNALKARRVGARRINVGQALMIAGTTQAPNVRTWMNSQQMADNLSNPHRGTYEVVEDTAIDLGVNDPSQNDLLLAGTPASVYAFTTGPKRSVKFAWRRGTGRGPVTGPAVNLSSTSTGQWGLAWKVYLDMGAAFQRRIGAVRVNITG